MDAGAPPPPSPVILQGILSQPAARGEHIRVFFVHGMGTGQTEYCPFASLMDHVAAALNVRQQRVTHPIAACGDLVVPEPRDIPAPAPTPFSGKLFTYTFANADTGREVQFSFLLWSPLTWPIKPSLNETGHPPWALLTGFAKSFLQTHLSDVVLYGGAYRKVMRPVVEQALCIFVGGQPQPDNPTQCPGGTADWRTVLITRSLGGYMLMDAIADIGAAHSQATSGARRVAPTDTNDAAAKALARTNLIFFLANQLAFLDLTTLTQYPPPARPVPSTSLTEKVESKGILPAFLQNWQPYHRLDGFSRQIVGITDLNDILTYLISNGNVPGLTDSTIIANVYLGTAVNWLNLFASPISAHINYLGDDNVAAIIVCGMTGSLINPCI